VEKNMKGFIRNRKEMLCVFALLCLVAFPLTALAQNPPDKPAQLSPEEFVFGQKGKIVVALFGIDGCPGTKKATEVLAEMSKDCPANVSLGRIDVPIEGNTQFKPLTTWSYNYYHGIDTDRKVADKLEFFYYPTLYVIDRDGEVRYSGECDREKLGKMIAEISKEEPGKEKKVYTLPMLAVGSEAPAIDAKSFKGGDVSLKAMLAKGPSLLFFTAVNCPFSLEAAKTIPKVAEQFKGKEFTIIIIENGTKTEAINDLYGKMELPGAVIIDADGKICASYHVDPVPFYFAIDKEGKITARGPYTEAAAGKALGELLGVKPADGGKTSGAG
jgi:peroxiredoxin